MWERPAKVGAITRLPGGRHRHRAAENHRAANHVSPRTRPVGIVAADDEVRVSAGVASAAPPGQLDQRHVAPARLDDRSEVPCRWQALHQTSTPGRSAIGSWVWAGRQSGPVSLGDQALELTEHRVGAIAAALVFLGRHVGHSAEPRPRFGATDRCTDLRGQRATEKRNVRDALLPDMLAIESVTL